MPDNLQDSDTTTGAGTTTGSGLNTVGGQTTGGPLTGGLAANAVTSGNSSKGTPMAGAIDSAPANPQDGNPDATGAGTQATGGGRAVPDFGPLASGRLSGGDTLDDAGGEDHDALAGNQDAGTGDTETGSMGVDAAALGGGAVTAGGLAPAQPDPIGGAAGEAGMAQGEGVR